MKYHADYFSSCHCIEELKELYRQLALKNHPDRGGVEEVMKAINASFDVYFERLKNIHMKPVKEGQPQPTAYEEKYYTASQATEETGEQFRAIINALLSLKGCKVELIGRWIWITGDTRQHKEKLKELGCRYCPKKQAWNYHHPSDASRSRRPHQMDELRTMYRTATIIKDEERLILA